VTVEDEVPVLFSIGHSHHSLGAFLDLLRRHGIEVLADVRSQPYSRFVPHFRREPLETALTQAGFRYVFLGRELGGRPPEPSLYDDDTVVYSRVAAWPPFLEGLEALQKLMGQQCVALMCAEENPAECHRYLLIGQALAARGVPLRHIRADGSVQAPDQVEVQKVLFQDQPEDAVWRSTRSASRRRRRPGSSAP
jgi:uncharacterized protein (DUF488 family)